MAYTPADEFVLDAEKRMERKFERVPLGFAQNPRNPEVLWRIYYVDASQPNGYKTVSNLEFPNPEDAPVNNVACILQYMSDQEVDVVYNIEPDDPENPQDSVVGISIIGDIYFINEFGRWQGGWADDTLASRDARGVPYSAVKTGYWTDNETYRRIMNIAAYDTDFPSGIIFPDIGSMPPIGEN